MPAALPLLAQLLPKPLSSPFGLEANPERSSSFLLFLDLGYGRSALFHLRSIENRTGWLNLTSNNKEKQGRSQQSFDLFLLHPTPPTESNGGQYHSCRSDSGTSGIKTGYKGPLSLTRGHRNSKTRQEPRDQSSPGLWCSKSNLARRTTDTSTHSASHSLILAGYYER